MSLWKKHSDNFQFMLKRNVKHYLVIYIIFERHDVAAPPEKRFFFSKSRDMLLSDFTFNNNYGGCYTYLSLGCLSNLHNLYKSYALRTISVHALYLSISSCKVLQTISSHLKQRSWKYIKTMAMYGSFQGVLEVI